MAYEKLNIYDGDIFTSEHIRHLEDGINQIEKSVDLLKENLVSTLNSKDVYSSVDEDISDILKKVNYLKSPGVPSYEYTDDIIDITKTVQSKQIQLVALDSGNCTGFGIIATTVFVVDWGDGTVEAVASNGITKYVKHTYTKGTGQYYDGTNTQFVITVAPVDDGLIQAFYNFNGSISNNIISESASILSFVSKDIFFKSINFNYMQRIKYIDLMGGSIGIDGNNISLTNCFIFCQSLERISGNVCWTSVINMMNSFSNCLMLTNLDLGEVWNTINCTSFINTFTSCSSLTELPAIVTNSTTNINNICSACSNLKTINGETWDLSLCKDAALAFKNCTNLSNVPYFANTNQLTNINEMFSGCQALTKLNEKQTVFNVDSVTYAGRMFYNCNSLIEAPYLDFKSATNINMLFFNCKSLYIVQESFDFPLELSIIENYADMNNGSGIELMFANCTSLTNAPQIYAPNALSVKGLFYQCKNLVNVPERYSFPNALNAYGMFNSCEKLKTAPVIEMPKVTNISSLFIKSGIIDTSGIMDYPEAISTSSMFSGCTSLVTAPEEIILPSATNISSMFSGCTSLVTPPRILSAESATAANNLFYNCTSLVTAPEEIILPSATNISSMFSGCTSLVTPPRNGIDAPKAIDAYYLFANCKSLQAVSVLNLPVAKNISNCYDSCKSLETTIEYNFPNVTNLGNFYKYCDNLKDIKKITVSNDIACVSEGFTYNNYSLISIEFPEGNTSMSSNWRNLTGSSVLKYIAGTIDARAFLNDLSNVLTCSSYLEGTITIKNLLHSLSLNGKKYLTGVRLVDPDVDIANLSITYCNLSADALNDLFNDLPTVSTQRTINVTGNPGVNECDTSIATNKNWSVKTA